MTQDQIRIAKKLVYDQGKTFTDAARYLELDDNLVKDTLEPKPRLDKKSGIVRRFRRGSSTT